MSKKKILLTVSILIAVVALVGVFLFWNSSPRRALNGFLKAVEAKNSNAALSFVSEEVKPSKKKNIEWFLEDWVAAENLTYQLEKDDIMLVPFEPFLPLILNDQAKFV